MRKRLRNSPEVSSQTWAHNLMGRDDWVVVDTETTGLGPAADLVEIAVLQADGSLVLEKLVNPAEPITPGATEMHGIKGDMLLGAPSFEHLYPELRDRLNGKVVIAYNAAFDRSVLESCCRRHSLPPIDVRWECALERYGRWRGFTTSLRVACQLERITIPMVHRAANDAKLVWNLIRAMAGLSAV